MLRERRGSLVLPRFSSMVTGPAFERVERLIEMEPLDRPQEVDDIAAGGTPEAVIGAGLRVHGERRHLLLVERTEARAGATHSAQLHVAPDHLSDGNNVLEVFDPLPER